MPILPPLRQDALAAARNLNRWLAGDTTQDAALSAIEAERRPLVANIQRLQDRAMRLLTMRGLIPDLLFGVVPRLLAASGIGRRVQWTFAYGRPDPTNVWAADGRHRQE